jgi:hypothetical protein
MGPQRWKPRAQDREFLTQQPGRTPLDAPDQLVDSKLGVDLDKKMHVIRHDFEFNDLCHQFVTDSVYNLFKACIDAVYKDGTAVLWAPDNVIFTGVYHVVV